MTLYRICISLHLLALSLWLGHMFVWSLFVGPALKKLEPRETAAMLRERSLMFGGLGWPALFVLALTGLYMLTIRGINPADLLAAATYQGAQGAVLAVKLCAVGVMIAYQAFMGHRSAPLAIYFNMLVATVVLGASVLLVRGWVS
jgi:uncharacterized membrane protein